MIVAALLFPFLFAVAPFGWLRKALGAATAFPLAVAWGTWLAALAGVLTTWLPGAVAGAGLLAVSCALFVFLTLRFPLPKRDRAERRESLVSRGFGWFLLVLVVAIGAVYLWANAVHPPVLADTLFRWSGPSRGLGPVHGFPLRLSALYYAFADTDLGWKFLWSALNLLPWLALFGVLRGTSRGLLAAAGATLAPAVSFSVLFWGSSGQPHLFLTGVVMLLWAVLDAGDDAGFLVAWPLVFMAAWSGPFWSVLAALPLAALFADPSRKPTHRGLAATAAAVLTTYWLARLAPVGGRLDDIVLYFLRDAWNTARYGPLAYLTAAFLLRSLFVDRRNIVAVVATLVMCAIFALELASQDEPTLQVLLHMTGNRNFACVLLIAWFLAVLPPPPDAAR